LPEATVVTVPRTYVDYVVTEYGIATLKGKSVKERIGELISVAHPDLRADLRREAKRLYGVEV
ncbi:MAG: acetyl-CoA hydrolase/transferase C-terminal domain-containing protein, partial [Chloroflexota bacterium]|nr:acetyl-CoA hydrolase/transferase C-terminal domain-containing protein [Chloroflexota bacterium]